MGRLVRTSPGYSGKNPTYGVRLLKNAADYLTYIKAFIVVNPKVLLWTVVREEVRGVIWDIALSAHTAWQRPDGDVRKKETSSVLNGRK